MVTPYLIQRQRLDPRERKLGPVSASLPRSRSVSRHATLLPGEERCVTRHRTAARETMLVQEWLIFKLIS